MRHFGRKLILHGLTHSQVGNMSIREGDTILISRSGSMLDELADEMIVEIGLDGQSSTDATASSDARIHRAIYQATSAQAIIHTHSPFAVAEALITPGSRIVSHDIETKKVLGQIPLVSGDLELLELAKECARILRKNRALIIRGHGSIAAADSLEEAYLYACSVEHACKVRHLCRRAGHLAATETESRNQSR